MPGNGSGRRAKIWSPQRQNPHDTGHLDGHAEDGCRTRVHGASVPLDLFDPGSTTVTQDEYYAIKEKGETWATELGI